MNRRSFISSMLAGVVAPLFLPGAGRIWKPIYRVVEYTFTLDQIPPHNHPFNPDYVLRYASYLEEVFSLEHLKPEFFTEPVDMKAVGTKALPAMVKIIGGWDVGSSSSTIGCLKYEL